MQVKNKHYNINLRSTGLSVKQVIAGEVTGNGVVQNRLCKPTNQD